MQTTVLSHIFTAQLPKVVLYCVYSD